MKQGYRRLLPGLMAVLALAMVLGLAGCGGGAPNANWELKISGAVSKPLTLSYGALAKMPQSELKDVLMQKSQGEDETHSFSGVALSALFAEAGVSDAMVSATVTAADGYAIEISKDELDGGIIALKQDGAWIVDDAKAGPIRLVCPKTPGNRWVFQLKEIAVK